LNSKGERKEKRARREVTRPKPTIYGNCDSWSFIVGKKPRAYSQTIGQIGSLQTSNKNVIHNLSTKYMSKVWDNVWAICGCQVDYRNPSRMVDWAVFDMPLIADEVGQFYPKM
jgi:hypothetical protein